jgi:putative ABC transport system permease protein
MADRYRREFRLWGSTPDRDADDEIRFHIEMRVAELVEAGMSEAAARAEAARAFGNQADVRREVRAIDRQTTRRLQLTTWLLDLRQDAIAALRQFRKAPGFTAAAVLTIALGIGATTAIFGVVNAVILRPLPFAEPDRVVLVQGVWRGQPSEVSAGNFVDWRAATRDVFSHMAAANYVSVNITGGSSPERVLSAQVSHGFFDVFGVAPILGRSFRAEEDRPGADGVAILSHGLFVTRYAADPSVLGTTIRVNDRPHVVVGVMPASLDYLAVTEALWVPIAFTPEREAMHDEHFLSVFARLKPGATLDQAADRLRAAAREGERRFPKDNKDLSARAQRYVDSLVGDVRVRLFTWLGAVGCVLLIACANVANLLLARGTGRARELAVRASLGASRWRIVRQLLAESLVLAGVGATAGVLLASAATRLLAAAGPSALPRLFQAEVDGVVLAFAMALTVLSAIVFGLAPALRAARTDLQIVVREGGRSSGGGVARDRLRTVLVAAEVALAVMLVIGAGLLLRAAWQLQQVPLGFDGSGVLTARVTLPETSYQTGEQVRLAFEAMVRHLESSPGVAAAAMTSQVPMGPGGNGNGLMPFDGREPSRDQMVPSRLRIVSPNYLSAMRVPLLKGRHFTADDRDGATRVTIISQSIADAMWPGQDPIGKRLLCCEGSEEDPRPKTVVGVVGNVRASGPGADMPNEFYIPAAQIPDISWSWIQRTMTLVARTDGDPVVLATPMREAVRAVSADLPLHGLATMAERLDRSLASSRFGARLVGALGLMALLLAAIGIYGVIAYFVGQRHHELGIRLALGATPGGIVRLVVGQAMTPVALGVAAGVAAAVFGARLLEGQLSGVSTADPMAFSLGVGLLVGVALIASALPARRASRVEPRRLVDG